MRKMMQYLLVFLLAVQLFCLQAEAAPIHLSVSDTAQEVKQIRSFWPQEDYSNVQSYAFYVGDDMSSIPETVASFQFLASVDASFSINPEKCIALYADWHLKGAADVETACSNIHFTLDSSVPGTYELIGDLIAPDGYAFAKGLTVPTAHAFITILENTGKKEISSIAPWGFSAFTNTETATAGDLTLEQELTCLADDGWTGLTPTDDLIPLDLRWDFDAVDFNTPGTYQATLHLSVSEDYQDEYVLPESLATVTKTIIITDGSLYIYLMNQDVSYYHVRYSDFLDAASVLKCYYLESSQKLSDAELSEASFSTVDDESFVHFTNVSVTISKNAMKSGMHYYFLMESDGVRSNILHFFRRKNDGTDDGSGDDSGNNFGNDGNMTGKRDGSDVVEPGQPAISQPGISDGTKESDATQKTDGTNGSTSKKNGKKNSKKNSKKNNSKNNGKNNSGNSDNNSGADNDGNSGTGNNSSADNNNNNNNRVSESETGSAVTNSSVTDASDTGSADASGSGSTDNGSADQTGGQSASLPAESVYDRVTEDASTLSAGRINLMKQEYSEYLPFTHHGITAYVPVSLLSVSDSDVVSVVLKKPAKDTFSFQLLINGREIALTEAVKIYYPSDALTYDRVYFEDSPSDIPLSDQGDFASLSIKENGTYRLSHSANTSKGSLPLSVISGSVGLTAVFLFSIAFFYMKKQRGITK